MANVTVAHVVNLVEETLIDSSNVDYTATMLVYWYNMACREIVKLAPDANAVTETVKLSVGAKQAAPAASVMILNVIRNMGADGLTPGSGITKIDLATLAVFDRTWSAASKQAAEALNWAPDSPLSYYVNPPSDGTGNVEILVAKVPNEVVWDGAGAWESAMVGIADKYVNALMNLMLFYAYMKDSDYPGNEQRCAKHWNLVLLDCGYTANSKPQPRGV